MDPIHLMEKVYHWLEMAFSQPLTSLKESHFYDQKDSKFYTVRFSDYLLLNDDLTPNKSAKSAYSKEVIAQLADKILRQEKKDVSILTIPRVDIDERKTVMEQFIGLLEDANLIRMVTQKMNNQDGSQRFDLHFAKDAETPRTTWEKLKAEFLRPRIDSFLAEHNIQLSSTTLWNT